MELKIISSVVVITPTIGKPTLKKAIESVRNQTHSGVRHLIVVDGHEYLNAVEKIYEEKNQDNICVLPKNVGKDNWYGHRVYAGFSQLVDDEYIFFLDEDNWYEHDHVEKLVEVMDQAPNADWGHSLRKIADESGNIICEDNCESLGPPFSPLVDTSSFCFRNSFYAKTGHLWRNKWGADRSYLAAIQEFNPLPIFQRSNVHTSVYRVGSNDNSPKVEMFLQGNEVVKNKLIEQGFNKYPWSSLPIQ
jgi:glycosyltransferase involved in cell wall biosynthesis